MLTRPAIQQIGRVSSPRGRFSRVNTTSAMRYMATRLYWSQPHESEIALLVTHNGREVVEDLAGMKSILHYNLKHRPIERIRDTYYDTVTRSLRRARIVVRLRHVNRRLFITLKANPRLLKGNGVRRTEIELPWSRESFVRIASIMGVKPQVPDRKFLQLAPSRVLATLGLRRVQQRLTLREVRDVLDERGLHQRIAEIAIDNTTYIIKRTRITIREIEIEAKKTGSFHPVQKLGEVLVALYPSSVRHWAYGKFVTGLAIQSLLERGKLQQYVGDGELKDRAYRLIEQEIRSTKCSPSTLC